MIFELSAQAFHVCCIGVGEHHAVRIAHRHQRHAVSFTAHFKRIADDLFAVYRRGYRLSVKYGRAHIHPYALDFAVFTRKKFKLFNARKGFNRTITAFNVTQIVRKLPHATDTVSAHFAFRPVGVEHTHSAIGFVGSAQKNYSVAPYPEMSVRKFYCKFFRFGYFAAHTVKIDIVVANAVHFIKFHIAFRFIFFFIISVFFNLCNYFR